MASVLTSLAAAALLLRPADAQDYEVGTTDQILESARTLAYDGMLFYKGNQSGEVPGLLAGPPTASGEGYYWWESGAMMGIYVGYWHMTDDDSYNEVVTQGLLHQVGPGADFMPLNYTASMGNDDQGVWGMSAMLAAESRFPNPPNDKPQWLDLAQAVFDSQIQRYDDATCDGGLRWQIPFSNVGYNYKNTMANGVFFDLGARLARYTGNDTYAQWASDTFDWLWNVGFIDNESWAVYDGAHVEDNCTKINKAQFSFNSAVLLHGCAFMYNHTNGDSVWKDRVDKLTEQTLDTFFPDNIAFEVACEGQTGTCTTDMLLFKGLAHQWLSSATQMAPFTSDRILPVLRDSATAAVKQCTGGNSGRQCGFYWSDGEYVDPSGDDTSGAGEALDVLAAVSSLLVEKAPAPATVETAGDSRGDTVEGTEGGSNNDDEGGDGSGAGRTGAGGVVALALVASGVSVFGSMLWI